MGKFFQPYDTIIDKLMQVAILIIVWVFAVALAFIVASIIVATIVAVANPAEPTCVEAEAPHAKP